MTTKVDVWMPLYVKDYLAATSRLSAEQHGAYLLLIMDYWLNGPLPDDDAALAQVAHLPLEQWSKHRPSIARFFAIGNGEWRHYRIDKELLAARDRRDQAKERGKLGAEARWGKSKHRASIEQASRKQSSKDSSAPAPAPAQSSTPSNQKRNGASAPAPLPKNSVPRPDDIDEQVWSDFLAHRRQKKAKLTPTAWKAIRKQLDAGIQKGHDPNEMLAVAMAAGWQGFELDWYENRKSGSGRPTGDEKRNNAVEAAKEYRRQRNG